MDFISNLSANMTEIFTEDLLPQLHDVDLYIAQTIQEKLKSYQRVMLLPSEYFSAANIMDIYVPLFGAFRHDVMVLLVTLLACVNTLTSLIKWTMPAHRPYWWVREYNDTNHLQQFHGTCETTGAFPSSHIVASYTLAYVIAYRFKYVTEWSSTFWTAVRLLAVSIIGALMAMSRIFMVAQFASQCVLSLILAMVMVILLDCYSDLAYSLSRLKTVLITCCLSLLPVGVYFGMQRLGLDPHWSVRMAFKWCAEPENMRHEDSSIFILGRDFGYLMGVVLSMPLRGDYERDLVEIKRFPLIFALEMLNYYARLETPKTYGRVAFVAYEFLRNATHSFTLLTILPKITTKPITRILLVLNYRRKPGFLVI